MKKYLSLLILVSISLNVISQDKPWKNKKAAVVITYDDAIAQHLDNAIPVLDSLGLKATFYVTASSQACRERIDEWKKVAANGHELGNHTLYHPCIGNIAGREWVSKEYDMSTYTMKRMVDEVRMTNAFLEALDGKKRRTFAFTCGDMKIGDVPFINELKNDFVAARGVRSEMHQIDQVDLYNVDCYVVFNNTAEQMIEWAKKAVETNSLLVILFHGVGGGNTLNVALPEHRKFLKYLKQNEKDLYIAPMIEVADYVNSKRNTK